MAFGGSTGVFAVIGKFMGKTVSGDRVRIDDGSTTTSDHGPDTALSIEDGELEGSTGGAVQFLDVGFLLCQITTKRSRPDHGRATVGTNNTLFGGRGSEGDVACDGPLGTADKVGGLVEFGSHIEVVDGGRLSIDGIEADKGVDFEVGKMEIDIDRIKADDEIDKSVLLDFGDVSEKSGLYFFAGGEGLVDRNGEFESFGVYITNIDTTLMSKEDMIAFTGRVDTNVKFRVGRVG